MNIVDKAQALALMAHHSDINKHDGEPYILHLHRVYMLVRDTPPSTFVQHAAAWLHDSVEDDKISFHEIRLALLGEWEAEEVISAVDALTKRSGESNEEYYHRCKANENARFVKLHGDIVDNFRRNHKIQDETTRLRMAKKYSLGMDILS